MQPSQLVTIVVPVYRGWSHLRRLASALDGALQAGGAELVVVDDHSDDGEARQFAAEWPRARTTIRSANGGFAAAVNTGLKDAGGDVVCVVNSDVEMSAEAVWALAALARENRNAIFGPRTLLPDGTVLTTARDFPTVASVLSELILPWRLVTKLKRVAGAWLTELTTCKVGKLQEVDWVLGACLVFHRDVVTRNGYFDEGYRMYSEEVDWQLRARDRGIARFYVPWISIQHDEGHGGRLSDERVAAIWRSRIRFIGIHHSALARRALKLGVTLSLFISGPLWCALIGCARTRALARAELRRHWMIVGVVARA